MKRILLLLVAIAFSMPLFAQSDRIDLTTQVKNVLPPSNGGVPVPAATPTGVPLDLFSLNGTETWGVAGLGGREVITGTTDAIVATDRSNFVIYSDGANAVAVTVPDAGTTNFSNHFVTVILNVGTGTVTLNRTLTSTINGGTSAAIAPASSCTLHSLDNANWLMECVALTASPGSISAAGNGLAICSDTSGSGTAQSCNTSPSVTPAVDACISYSTTTANSGSGLTVNVNSLGATPVAIAGSSGWTTTLTASIIPAGKPVLMCYDGTNWDVQQTGTASAGVTPSSSNPLMDGTAAPGSSTNYSRADHVHPSDTSRVSTSTTVNGHALSANVVVSASDLTTGTLPHAQLPALVSGDIPNNAANTSGTAANLSGTPALNIAGWQANSTYYQSSTNTFGKVRTAEGQSVSSDFNFNETPGSQGGACPATAAGVVSVTNGSQNVTYVSGSHFVVGTIGSSANWIGQWITLPNGVYQVASVAGATSTLTLATNYTGTTSSSAAYSVGSQWADSYDHVLSLGWNFSGNGGTEATSVMFPWGDSWDQNWCAGNGETTVERYTQITLPDGNGGTYLYRPVFMDVSKTANTASRTHVGFTNLNFSADVFTLGSITSLSAHTVSNYFSVTPSQLFINPPAVLNAGLTVNNGAGANGLTLIANSAHAAYNTEFIDDVPPGSCPGLASTNVIYMGNSGTYPDQWYTCPKGSTSAAGHFGINAINSFANNGAGFYSTAGGSSLAGDIIESFGSNGGMSLTSSYTNASNWAGFTMTPNGSYQSAMYLIGINAGSPTTSLSNLYVCGWSGITCNLYGSATKDLVLTGSGVAVNTLGASTSTNVCFASGNILAGCTSLTRYKDKIATYDTPSALEHVMRLRPVSYVSKTNGRNELGFLAEEVEKEEPRLATYGQVEPHGEVGDPNDPKKILTPATNQEVVLNGVDYGHVSALLTAALQEQQKEIRQLQEQLATLRAQTKAAAMRSQPGQQAAILNQTDRSALSLQ